MRRLLSRFSSDEAGSSTVELTIVLAFFLMLVITMIEAGWLMTKSMMLDRGLEIAMRDIRLGKYTNPTADQVRGSICENAIVFANCQSLIKLELTPISNSADFPTDGADCADRSITDLTLRPQDDFNAGSRSEVMFVRVCMIVDPLVLRFGLGKMLDNDPNGGIQMIAMSAFVNEPD